MQIVELFAGGGGVACGLKDVLPQAEVWAVEQDPSNPELSRKIADNYLKNFPSHHLIRKTVQECDLIGWKYFPRYPQLLWASTVCCNFSVAKKGREESRNDLSMAIATMGAVYHLQPEHFVLENVAGYKDSNAFRYLILSNLDAMGYKYDFSVCRVSPIQSRNRLILRASKKEYLPKFDFSEQSVNWWDVIKNIPSEESDKEPIEVNLPTWKFRIGRRYKPFTTCNDFPTIIKSFFMDGKGANRNSFADIFLPDGTVKKANMEMIKQLSHFPEWYKLSGITAVDGAILGNAVPPIFVSKLCQPIMTI